MLGNIELSETDLQTAIAGGFAALEAGINSGLSAGFMFLDLPRVSVEKGEGTTEKPDIVKYGHLELREISLTSIPRLKDAGIVQRLDGADLTPEMAEGDGDDGE